MSRLAVASAPEGRARLARLVRDHLAALLRQLGEAELTALQLKRLQELRSAYVLADLNERRALISTRVAELAAEQKGSWWLHWIEWLKTRSGTQVAARNKPGNTKYKVIEAAPGRYVKEKA